MPARVEHRASSRGYSPCCPARRLLSLQGAPIPDWLAPPLQMKDLPADPTSAAAAANLPADASVEPAPPNPFSSGARAKL